MIPWDCHLEDDDVGKEGKLFFKVNLLPGRARYGDLFSILSRSDGNRDPRIWNFPRDRQPRFGGLNWVFLASGALWRLSISPSSQKKLPALRIVGVVGSDWVGFSREIRKELKDSEAINENERAFLKNGHSWKSEIWKADFCEVEHPSSVTTIKFKCLGAVFLHETHAASRLSHFFGGTSMTLLNYYNLIEAFPQRSYFESRCIIRQLYLQ